MTKSILDTRHASHAILPQATRVTDFHACTGLQLLMEAHLRGVVGGRRSVNGHILGYVQREIAGVQLRPHQDATLCHRQIRAVKNAQLGDIGYGQKMQTTSQHTPLALHSETAQARPMSSSA